MARLLPIIRVLCLDILGIYQRGGMYQEESRLERRKVEHGKVLR